MKANRFITRTLLIRENEWELVNRLFTFEFFQGISIAIFFYCSISLFLEHLPTNALAYAFILSAVLLWICGAVYSRLEHRFETKHLILMVVGINAALILFFRIGLLFDEPVWFYYLMLAGFNVAYLLNNLEFWGSAALIFDVRQSKRLFSIISAGDIPAKLVGFLASGFLGKLIGQEPLLWIAFGSLIVSIYFYRRLIATGAFEKKEHKKEHEEEHMNPTAEGALHLVRENPLIRQAALISFFSYSAFILLNFLFFGYVKEASHNESENLAIYIAVFLAGSRAITLLFKLMVTNRLADNLGIRTSLLITPILLFAMSLIVLPASMQNSLLTVFYAFATITITIDVLRAAIQSPVLLAAMQPLPVHERLSGHTIIKGITDPFAFFFIGTLLAIFFFVYPEVDYRVMSLLLFILIIGWIVSVLRFGRIYNQTLQKAIRDRSIQEREISITDRESLQIMQDKIARGEPGEAVLALNLAKDLPAETRKEFLQSAVENLSPFVQLKAVVLARQWNMKEFLPNLRILASSASDYQVLTATIAALSEMDESFNSATFLRHLNPDVVAATIAQSIKRQDASQSFATELLQSWVKSEDHSLRQKAAEIIGDAKSPPLLDMLRVLMNDSDVHVKEAAILAAGKQKTMEAAAELLGYIRFAPWQSKVIDALQSNGAASVQQVRQFIITCDDEMLQKKLILLLGRIGGKSATDALDMLADEIPSMTDTLFRAMNHSGFTADQHNNSKYLRMCRDYLNSGAYIAYIIRYLENKKADTTVIRAFESEMQMLRDRLMYLFSFIYDRVSMAKVKAGFELGSRESISNALEIVSITTARELSKDFIALFEDTSYQQKCSLLEGTHPEPRLSEAVVADEVFRDLHHQYHSWTKSVVMYFLNKDIPSTVKKSIGVFRFSKDPLLKQTAEWLIGKSTLA